MIELLLRYLPQLAVIVLAALIGWITNVVAIKMLFHPRKAINLGFMQLQGVFPKRQKQFADRLANLVASELFSGQDVHDKLKRLSKSQEFRDDLLNRLKVLFKDKLPVAVPMLAMFMTDETIGSILNQIKPDVGTLLDELIDSMGDRIKSTMDVKAIIEGKVNAFSTDRLEEVINDIMSREFREVEIIGGVLGFVIGLLQVGLQHL